MKAEPPVLPPPSTREESFLDHQRFTMQRRLGAGGMGVVYQVLDLERNQVVALKTLRDVDATGIVRFKREFRALADVSHPNLISLYELISAGDRLFFTMELIDGTSFLRWLRDEPDQPVDQTFELQPDRPPTDTTSPAKRLSSDTGTRPGLPIGRQPALPVDLARLRPALRQLAEGVAAIHGAGLLHRDLKPSNVLVTRDGLVKILDFGLITELKSDRAQPKESLAGTAAYMSPEQGAQLALSPASDWYAVGVMLYEALTGRQPFVGSPTDLLMDKQQFEPAPPCQLQPDTPQDLNALCVELLRRDPEARPAARDVLRRLGSDAVVIEASRSQSSAGDLTLVGRARHLDALESAFHAVRDGGTVVEFVHGPSGMGKSALVRRFLDELEHREAALVLTGRCYERESVPYKAVDSLIDALSHHLAQLPRLQAEGVMPRDVHALARLFPVLRQVEAVTAAPRRAFEAPDPHEVRRRAFAALRELLARLSDRRPVVLAIDDLQWGDVDSAALLAALLRPPDAPSLLLVASHRSEDELESPFLKGFRSELQRRGVTTRELSVGPLDPDEATALGLALLGSDDQTAQRQATRIAEEAQGSPFFIHELARHVRDGERSTPELISLDELLRARLRRLPEPAARLLGIVATAGRPILLSVAQRAAEVLDPSALAVLKAGNLVRARRAGGDSSMVECYHDRIGETAMTLLDPAAQRRNHLRLAIALESSPQPDAEALALHFRQAGELERAAEFARQAAHHAAEALAFNRAARLYRLAIDLRPHDNDRTGAVRQLHVRLGDALANAGHGAEAAEAYLKATDKASAADGLDLRRRAATSLLLSGHFPEGIAALREVLGAVGMKLPATPAAALATLLWRRARLRLRGHKFRERDASQVPADQLTRIDVADAAMAGFGMVDSLRAAGFQAKQLQLALDAGEPLRVARALNAEACFVALAGASTHRRVARTLSAVEELARRLDSPVVDAMYIGACGIVAIQHGRWRVSVERCEKAEQLLRERCTGLMWELNTMQIFSLMGRSLLGEMGEVSRRLPVLLKEAEERGDLYSQTNLLSAVGYLPPMCVDEPARARRELMEALARWNVPNDVHVQHLNALAGEVAIDLYCGDPMAAYDRMAGAWKRFERALMFRIQTLRANGLYARGRASAASGIAGKLPDRLRAAEADGKRLEREGVGYCVALGRSLRAAVALGRGDQDLALRLLGETEQLFKDAEMSLHFASARRRRGKLLGGDEGALLVESADEIFRRELLRKPAQWTATLIAAGIEE